MSLMPLLSLYESKQSDLLQELKNVYQEELMIKIYPDQETEFLEIVSGINNPKLQDTFKALKNLKWNDFLKARQKFIELIRSEAFKVFNWILEPVEEFNQKAIETENDFEAQELITKYQKVSNIAYAFMAFFRHYQLRFFDSWYEAWNPDCWTKLRIFELTEAEK